MPSPDMPHAYMLPPATAQQNALNPKPPNPQTHGIGAHLRRWAALKPLDIDGTCRSSMLACLPTARLQAGSKGCVQREFWYQEAWEPVATAQQNRRKPPRASSRASQGFSRASSFRPPSSLPGRLPSRLPSQNSRTFQAFQGLSNPTADIPPALGYRHVFRQTARGQAPFQSFLPGFPEFQGLPNLPFLSNP